MAGMTRRQVIDLLGAPTRVLKGRALGVLNPYPTGRSNLTPAQAKFVQEVTKSDAKLTPIAPHPEDRAALDGYRRKPGEELTAVELAWLQRLPLEPEKVTFDDAVQLAALDHSIREATNPASARLIRSIWEPVKDLHDIARAEAKLRRAKAEPNAIPSSAFDALVDALKSEYPDASEAMLEAEAREILGRLRIKRADDRAREIERATSALEEARGRKARRGELTREASA